MVSRPSAFQHDAPLQLAIGGWTSPSGVVLLFPHHVDEQTSEFSLQATESLFERVALDALGAPLAGSQQL
jgi:hypothetical protein